MERTEQEKRVEQALMSLLDVGAKYIELIFLAPGEMSSTCRGEPIKETQARRINDYVQLVLVEPMTSFDLDQWAEAIVKAEEICDKLEKELMWAFSNPNFFKAIKAKVENRKTDLKYGSKQKI